MGKPNAPDQLDKVEIHTQLPLARMQANEERQGNLLQEYEQRFEKLSEDQKLSRLCSEAGFEMSRNWTIFSILFPHQGEKEIHFFMPRKHDASRSRRNSYQWVDPKQCTIWPCLGHKKFGITTEDVVLKFKFFLCFKVRPFLGFEL